MAKPITSSPIQNFKNNRIFNKSQISNFNKPIPSLQPLYSSVVKLTKVIDRQKEN